MTDMTSLGFAAVDLLTHDRRNPATIEKVTQINSYHVNQVAGCIEKLKAVRQGDGQSAQYRNGRIQSRTDLRTDRREAGGRSVGYRKETPISNMLLSMMEMAGVQGEHFGEGTGRLLEGLDLA